MKRRKEDEVRILLAKLLCAEFSLSLSLLSLDLARSSCTFLRKDCKLLQLCQDIKLVQSIKISESHGRDPRLKQIQNERH